MFGKAIRSSGGPCCSTLQEAEERDAEEQR